MYFNPEKDSDLDLMNIETSVLRVQDFSQHLIWSDLS